MKLCLDTPTGPNQIQAYEPGRLRVDGKNHTDSLILSRESQLSWRPTRYSELTEADFEPILALKPALVILGLGAKLPLFHPKLVASFYSARIAVEWMDSLSAARTYQLLRAEDRNVTAAIIIDTPA